ncbi:Aca1p NDAI_0G01920 [Naumovozyma dairenensis CBS 421]|uniref:BZIP domain-containing protein n=1 Tax=Naumovozyma dairenensis (strain ATCC 10597 / BCRC 20456 / CBS 421 / NBRC 0211 / NRRL Y-12639) TaxID=1071378 RepID=G0WDV6_NAUDC|nr:hypothetical protein NDAI_0G01920 [Naumovozyma dairenensis CBS 421]CCD25967.2 hypothetical protein NDAI_0G01920 [Naumovozyma dairenensis CBS 421]
MPNLPVCAQFMPSANLSSAYQPVNTPGSFIFFLSDSFDTNSGTGIKNQSFDNRRPINSTLDSPSYPPINNIPNIIYEPLLTNQRQQQLSPHIIPQGQVRDENREGPEAPASFIEFFAEKPKLLSQSTFVPSTIQVNSSDKISITSPHSYLYRNRTIISFQSFKTKEKIITCTNGQITHLTEDINTVNDVYDSQPPPFPGKAKGKKGYNIHVMTMNNNNMEHMQTPKEAERERLLERNRLAASKCRKRKRLQEEKFQEDYRKALQENSFLKKKIELYEKWIKNLKTGDQNGKGICSSLNETKTKMEVGKIEVDGNKKRRRVPTTVEELSMIVDIEDLDTLGAILSLESN